MNPAPGAPVVAQIVIQMQENGTVAYQANIPSLNAALAILERAKLEMFFDLRRKGEAAAASLIETPTAAFDPRNVPSSNVLRNVA